MSAFLAVGRSVASSRPRSTTATRRPELFGTGGRSHLSSFFDTALGQALYLSAYSSMTRNPQKSESAACEVRQLRDNATGTTTNSYSDTKSAVRPVDEDKRTWDRDEGVRVLFTTGITTNICGERSLIRCDSNWKTMILLSVCGSQDRIITAFRQQKSVKSNCVVKYPESG